MGANVTTTVSIGRNIGTIPMDEREWQNYTADVTRIIRNHAQAIHFIGFGNGIYEGMEEESFTLVVAVPLPILEQMKESLRFMLETYAQESIAITAGSTRFIYA